MEYVVHLAIIFAIYAMLGVSLNLVVGYTGLLSVTHAAFYGIGAYAVAILLTRTNTLWWTTLPVIVSGSAGWESLPSSMPRWLLHPLCPDRQPGDRSLMSWI